jgi:hypothetical protein
VSQQTEADKVSIAVLYGTVVQEIHRELRVRVQQTETNKGRIA